MQQAACDVMFKIGAIFEVGTVSSLTPVRYAQLPPNRTTALSSMGNLQHGGGGAG